MISLRLNDKPIGDPFLPSSSPCETPLVKNSSWDLRLVSTIHHLLNEWTKPELMLGMALGHVAWGTGRLLGCGLFSWARLGGSAALWAGRGGGIFMESAAWTAAGQLGHTLRTGQRGADDWKREWLSTAVLGASLRSVQGAFAGVGTLGMALATFGGLVFTDRALALSGLAENKTWSQTLFQSSVLFGGFHVSGLLARRFWGTSLARLDQAFDAKVRKIQSSQGNDGGSISADPLGVLQRQFAGPPVQVFNANKPYAMAADSKSGEPPGRYRGSPSPQSSAEKPLGGMGTREHPWRVEDMTQLFQSVTHPDNYFQFRLLKEDVYFLLDSIAGFSSGRVHALFNQLKYLPEISDGTKIQVRFEAHHLKFEYIKFDKRFALREGSTSAPPQGEMKQVSSGKSRFSDTSQTLQQVRDQMDGVAARRSPPPARPSLPPQMPAVNHSSQPSTSPSTPTAKGSQPPLKLVESLEDLNAYIQALTKNGSGTISEDILLNRLKPLETEELYQASETAKKLKSGSRIGIHDPQRHRSFNFTKVALKIQGDNIPWEPPKNFDRFSAQDLLDVLKKLSFLRGYSDPRKGLVIVDVRGRWRIGEDGGKMEKFLNKQIPETHRSIQIHQDSLIQSFSYDGGKRLWVMGTGQ